MADQQPGDPDPAAELPDTRVDGGCGQPTADAPARWSGAAAVPARSPQRRWWSRRRGRPEPLEHTAVDPEGWASIPAVDPWAGQDTAWDGTLAVTEVPLPPTAIQPLVLGAAEPAVALAARLAAEGLLVPAIRPPTVPRGTARLRISLSSAHEPGDVARLVAALQAFQRNDA